MTHELATILLLAALAVTVSAAAVSIGATASVTLAMVVPA